MQFQGESDRYEVERELGRGGFGTAYLVRDSSGARHVLKQLRLEALEEWKSLELFERESKALMSLVHPGIPRYVDRIEDQRGEVLAMVQQYVEGPTLQELIDEQGPMAPEDFERALRDCLEILAYLHSRVPPVIHRDITPKNIILGPERAYLIDFGSVRWAMTDSTTMTSVGTFGYMAPEQQLGRAEPASDVFGLGMTFAALAARSTPQQFPVDRQSGQIDVAAVLDLPAPLTQVLVAMTRPGLDQRLGDATAALDRLDRGHALTPAAPAPNSSSAPSAPLFVVVGALIVFFASGLIGYLFFVAQDSADRTVEVTRTIPAAPVISQPVTPLEPEVITSPPPTPNPPPPPPEPRVVEEELAPTPFVAEELDDDNSATLKLVSEPSGAEVWRGQQKLGVTPLEVRLPFGKHPLELRRDGRKFERTVNVLHDTVLNVTF